MRKTILVILLVTVIKCSDLTLLGETTACNPEQNGIYASKISAFVDAINRLRNNVAAGVEENHKNLRQPAANMNYLAWNDGIARAAQNCAQKCPYYEGTCKGLIGLLGYVSNVRAVVGTADWDPKKVLQEWLDDPEDAKQILWARAKTFGCGRSLNVDRVSRASPQEHIVCLFDENVRDGMEPYVAGTTASACAVGTASGYFALCATPYNSKEQKHQFVLGGQQHGK